jgi:hypothetical protein
MTSSPNLVHTITVHGVLGVRTEVVSPIKVNGSKTLVAFIKDGRRAQKWVSSDRIESRER